MELPEMNRMKKPVAQGGHDKPDKGLEFHPDQYSKLNKVFGNRRDEKHRMKKKH